MTVTVKNIYKFPLVGDISTDVCRWCS